MSPKLFQFQQIDMYGQNVSRNDPFWKGRWRSHKTQTHYEFVSSKSLSKDVPLCYHVFMTPLMDHKDDEGIILKEGLFLRIRVEKAEVPWTKLTFESK